MNIFLDIVILLTIAGGVFCFLYKSHKAAVASFGIIVLTLALSWGLSVVGSYVTALAVRPMVFSAGVKETAALVGAPVEKNTADTLAGIDPERILTADRDSLAVMAKRYGFSVEDLQAKYDAPETLTLSPGKVSEGLIREMVKLPVRRISRMSAWLILYVVLYFVLREVCRGVFHNQFRRPERKQFSAISAVLGLVSGVLMVFFLVVPCVQLLLPCEIGVLELLRLPESTEHSVLYGWFGNKILIK